MPKYIETNDDNDKNAAFKSARRTAKRDSQARASGLARRSRERHLSVRSELRETPDMRKIARAVIAMAMAQAEADAAAEATMRAEDQAVTQDQDGMESEDA